MRAGSLVPTEPEQARNARLWSTTRADPPITPIGDVKNAATRADAARSVAVITTVRQDLFEQTRPEPQKETKMPRDTKENIEARRVRLRLHLEVHGPQTRSALREALGYESLSPLLSDLAAIGAGPTERNGRTVALASQVTDAPKPRRAAKATPIEPVRPSLAVAAIAAVRQADSEGAPLWLDHEFVSALAARLAEAGL